ncbi:MAG TPA: hypothetical protein VGE13_01905 [Candidatus Saccharimonadales bacterium]
MRIVRQSERGGVSIFIVIFTALLLTVATTSFVQLMVRNQQQASTNDLSQSAYDAALAGVEDAKRALVALSKCEGKDTDGCNTLRSRFASDSQKCEFLGAVNVSTFTNGEVQVGSDPSLNQAYTCVKVKTNNPDYRGRLDGDSGGNVIRLQPAGTFDRVKISWFSNEDVTKDNPAATTGFPVSPDPVNNAFALLTKNSWSNSAASRKSPPVLRAQLIQFKKRNIQLDRFDSTGDSDAHTAFLYPNESNSAAALNWSSGMRAGTNVPSPASCSVAAPASGYHCQAILRLPTLLGETADTTVSVGNREMYLQLAAIYGPTRYTVELLNGNDPVAFDGGQAVVDSTGRASSLFRRISARVSVKATSLKYPEAALTVRGDLCKNFFITKSIADYSNKCPVN